MTIQEYIQKENIQFVIDQKLNPEVIHQQIVKALTFDVNAPLDVLEETEIMSIRKIYLCAYQYYVKSPYSYSYTYEHEYKGERSTERGTNDEIRLRKEIVAGNLEYDFIVCTLRNSLMDILEQNVVSEFPEISLDAQMLASSLQYTDFSTEMFDVRVEAWKKEIREEKNLDPTDSIIFNALKCELVRALRKIVIGVFEITCNYKGKEYFLYSSGKENDDIAFREIPVGTQQYDAKKERKEVEKKIYDLIERSAKISFMSSVNILFFTPMLDMKVELMYVLIFGMVLHGLLEIWVWLLGINIDHTNTDKLFIIGMSVSYFIMMITLWIFGFWEGLNWISVPLLIWSEILLVMAGKLLKPLRELQKNIDAYSETLSKIKEEFEQSGRKIMGAKKLNAP